MTASHSRPPMPVHCCHTLWRQDVRVVSLASFSRYLLPGARKQLSISRPRQTWQRRPDNTFISPYPLSRRRRSRTTKLLFALAAQRDNGPRERAAVSSDIEAATLSRRSTVLALRPLFDYFGLDATPAANTSVAIDPDRHFAAVNYRSAKALLDHFIGNGEQCRRYGKAERPGGL